MQVVVVMVP